MRVVAVLVVDMVMTVVIVGVAAVVWTCPRWVSLGL
jgi:hypothetical protein